MTARLALAGGSIAAVVAATLAVVAAEHVGGNDGHDRAGVAASAAQSLPRAAHKARPAVAGPELPLQRSHGKAVAVTRSVTVRAVAVSLQPQHDRGVVTFDIVNASGQSVDLHSLAVLALDAAGRNMSTAQLAAQAEGCLAPGGRSRQRWTLPTLFGFDEDAVTDSPTQLSYEWWPSPRPC